MYLPPEFREDDEATLLAFIEAHPFGLLITGGDGPPEASHIPFLLDRDGKRLLGHLARNNPQARTLGDGGAALAIFHGPHAYVSPSWYADPQNVPTWNYAAVHVHGVSRIVEDGVGLLTRLTAAQEARFADPWTFDPASAWVRSRLDYIVPFEIPIERMEGKFKLNQNRTAADRAGVIRALENSEDTNEHAIAALMRKL